MTRPDRKWTARIVVDYSDGLRARQGELELTDSRDRTMRGTGEHAIEMAAKLLSEHDDPNASARVWLDKHLVTGTTRDERQYAYLWREGELGELVYVDR